MFAYTIYEKETTLRTIGGFQTEEAAIQAAERDLDTNGGDTAEIFRRLRR